MLKSAAGGGAGGRRGCVFDPGEEGAADHSGAVFERHEAFSKLALLDDAMLAW
jgi:hypothetical protein